MDVEPGPRERMPTTIEPMLAIPGELPDDSDGEWAYEIKWDGIRALAAGGEHEWRLWSRRGDDLTERYPELVPIAVDLPPGGAILDGEVVAFDQSGRPSFQLLQRRIGLTSPGSIRRRAAESPVTYVIFDLLYLDGQPTIELRYSERRQLLAGLGLDGPAWQAPSHRVGSGAELLKAVTERGLEGVVAKRLDSPYRPGTRSRAWIKHRVRLRQEFVIGGWIPGEGTRSNRVGSLLVGYWDRGLGEATELGEPQRLVYAGAVGSGLTESGIEVLTKKLSARERERSPFDLGSPTGRKAGRARFCEPELVCEVAWTELTDAGTMRQPAFKGMRADKDPREVILEGATPGPLASPPQG